MNTATQAHRGPYGKADQFRGIKAMRVRLGLVQADAARRCGVSLRTFQRAEAGDVVPISVKRAIERSLGCSW